MVDRLHTALHGERVRLEPLGVHHAASLERFATPAIMRFMVNWRLGPSFDEVVQNVRSQPGLFPFAMVLTDSGLAVGSTSFLDVRPEHRSVEIGATWIGLPYQGTFVNPEAKLLMLGYAFDALGCVRVQLKTDARNEHSRRAMLKLGCGFEGVLRNHMVLQDGYIRDTAYFSILDTEWPAVREGLLARLALA